MYDLCLWLCVVYICETCAMLFTIFTAETPKWHMEFKLNTGLYIATCFASF